MVTLYYYRMLSPQVRPNHPISALLNGLLAKINTQITSGDLPIAPFPQQLPLNHPLPSKVNRSDTSFVESRSSPLFKSEHSPEQQREVRRLKAQMIKFQQALQQKNREAEEFERELLEQERRQRSNRLRAQSERHKEAVLVRKQQRWLQKKEEELLASPKQSRLAQKLLYQEMEKRRQAQEDVQERERNELLSVLSQQRRGLVNIARLGEHEQSYLRKVRQEKAERMRRMEEARETSKMIEEGEANGSLKSKTYLRVVSEMDEQKRATEEAEKQRQHSQQRLKEFLQRVRSQSELAQQRRPLRNTTRTKQQQSHSEISRPNLTQMQLNQLGNRFLRDSLKRIAKHPQKRSIATEPQKQPQHQAPDYLHELRRQRTHTNSKSFSQLHQHKIQRILALPVPRQQKVEKLKKLAHRLQAGPSSSDAEAELQKIHAKMKILSAALLASQQ